MMVPTTTATTPIAWSLRLLAALGIAAAMLGAPARTLADGEMSKANTLLFQTPHLQGLQSPAVLRYRLESTGPEGGEAFADEIALQVRPNPDRERWHVAVDYLSGERERPVPPVPAATGNPIIKVFLQREVVEMEERTGGSWRYFQKRIKAAFADAADVTRTEVDYDGRSLPGRQIRIAPYRGDPRSGQMGVYAGMRYTIVLSDEIPGQVYAITASAPAENGGEPAFAEGVELVGTEGLPTE